MTNGAKVTWSFHTLNVELKTCEYPASHYPSSGGFWLGSVLVQDAPGGAGLRMRRYFDPHPARLRAVSLSLRAIALAFAPLMPLPGGEVLGLVCFQAGHDFFPGDRMFANSDATGVVDRVCNRTRNSANAGLAKTFNAIEPS